MTKRTDYYTSGQQAGTLAARNLSDAAVLGMPRSLIVTHADAASLDAAQTMGIKRTTQSFFDGYKSGYTAIIHERAAALKELAKPVFWGDDKNAPDDDRLWPLAHAMYEIRSTQREVIGQCTSIIRDAQRTLDRAQAGIDAKIVNDRLYPIYDENLGQMGQRVDVLIAKLRQLQESTRAMVGVAGMRLPNREELIKAGLLEAKLESQLETADGE